MPTGARAGACFAMSAQLARPMLRRLREQTHAICPEAEETAGRGARSLSYRGRNSCGLAGFKSRVAFFAQGEHREEGAGGTVGSGRICCPADLSAKAALAILLKACKQVIETGPAAAAPVRRLSRDLQGALTLQPARLGHLDHGGDTGRRPCPPHRTSRGMAREGKVRNRKYMRK